VGLAPQIIKHGGVCETCNLRTYQTCKLQLGCVAGLSIARAELHRGPASRGLQQRGHRPNRVEFWALKMLLKFQNKTEHIVDDDDSWSGSYGGHVAMTPNQELSLLKSSLSGFNLAEKLGTSWCLTHMKIYYWGTEVLVY
jgi:hypothetical protein